MRPENTTKGLPLPLSWLLQFAIYFQEKKEPLAPYVNFPILLLYQAKSQYNRGMGPNLVQAIIFFGLITTG